MANNLEEIFWKDGRWENCKGCKVDPKPIGHSQIADSLVEVKPKDYPSKPIGFAVADERELLKNIKEKLEDVTKKNPDEKGYLDVNAYSIGEYGSAILPKDGTIVQFYRI